jgi:hypothetical protein
MTTLSFTANEVGVFDDEYTLIASLGVTDPVRYVTFQRSVEGGDDDWGIHFEFNDQINGKYECIKSCSLTRDRLLVELTEPIDTKKEIQSVDVSMEVSEDDLEAFTEMLRRIFRGKLDLLTAQ